MTVGICSFAYRAVIFILVQSPDFLSGNHPHFGFFMFSLLRLRMMSIYVITGDINLDFGVSTEFD